MLKNLRLVALLLVLFASPAFAQDGGGLLDPNPGVMIWTVIIFGFVLFVLYKAAYPKILGVVEAREQHIRDLLEAAARDRAEAQALLEEHRRERDATRAQAHDVLAEGRAAGERLREEILAEARREQQELLERTRRDIRQEMERSVAELRIQAVDLAIAAATKLVHRNLNDDDNRRLVREYVEQIDLREPSGTGVGA
ncbi:MAG: F0F1 ATP synthase subunit B [Gemmatimonadetes bacterium]|nr:F0F1 ATP synthase subunit B [Gemmatimonadota bacterium]